MAAKAKKHESLTSFQVTVLKTSEALDRLDRHKSTRAACLIQKLSPAKLHVHRQKVSQHHTANALLQSAKWPE